jgi:hypothetical protein
MNIDELAAELRTFVGRRVRISSSVVCQSRWELLRDVTINDGKVWCHGADGTSWAVVADDLVVDVEPVLGSYDLANAPVQMRAVGTALTSYGPTPTQLRHLCHCKSCDDARNKRTQSERVEDEEFSGTEPSRSDDLFPDF